MPSLNLLIAQTNLLTAWKFQDNEFWRFLLLLLIILLTLAVGGWFDQPHLPPENMAPQRLYVDYVRVYRRAGSGS